MAVILSERDRMRLEKAIRNSPGNQRITVMQRAIEARRRTEEARKQKALDLFMSWDNAYRFVQALEDIRDANTPKTHDEEWNKAFCCAVEMLSYAKWYARERWLDYMGEGGDG